MKLSVTSQVIANLGLPKPLRFKRNSPLFSSFEFD